MRGIIDASVGIIFIVMPSFVISQDILHIIGIIMPGIMPFIIGIIMPGIMPFIIGIMFMPGIMPFIIGIMFMPGIMPIMPFIIGIMPIMPFIIGIMDGIALMPGIPFMDPFIGIAFWPIIPFIIGIAFMVLSSIGSPELQARTLLARVRAVLESLRRTPSFPLP